MVNCKDDCRYWTYNKTSETCYYSKILIAKHDISGPEIVTGSAHCKSNTIYFPHCAELNVNYTEVVNISKNFIVQWSEIQTALLPAYDVK